MKVQSFYFKQKAKASLKDNWQTALLVTFFSGVLMTVVSLIRNEYIPDPLAYFSYALDAFSANDIDRGYRYLDQFSINLYAVKPAVWWLLGTFTFLSFIITPVLTLSRNHYFVCRIRGEELGFSGIISRKDCFVKAIWLYILIAVKVFLWSCLFIIPGILAAIRYSMAPFYMAEDPSITAKDAIEKSKRVMNGQKGSYFFLLISFYGWLFLSMALQMLIYEISAIAGLVAAQFMQLVISVYMNASFASFFLTVSDEGGMRKAYQYIRRRFEEMGVASDQIEEIIARGSETSNDDTTSDDDGTTDTDEQKPAQTGDDDK